MLVSKIQGVGKLCRTKHRGTLALLPLIVVMAGCVPHYEYWHPVRLEAISQDNKDQLHPSGYVLSSCRKSAALGVAPDRRVVGRTSSSSSSSHSSGFEPSSIRLEPLFD